MALSIEQFKPSSYLSRCVRNERPFWQTRYYDFNVWNPEKTTEKLKYMHRNPVKRGLVSKPEDWAWSSFRHYRTGLEGTVEIESFWTAAKRGNQLLKTQVSKARPGAPGLWKQLNVTK